MSKLQKDLQVVFGFSAENARRVEELWRCGKLPTEFRSAVQNVFYNPFDKINPDYKDDRPGPVNAMNKLNLMISNKEI
jgi:hypothetical protein